MSQASISVWSSPAAEHSTRTICMPPACLLTHHLVSCHEAPPAVTACTPLPLKTCGAEHSRLIHAAIALCRSYPGHARCHSLTGSCRHGSMQGRRKGRTSRPRSAGRRLCWLLLPLGILRLQKSESPVALTNAVILTSAAVDQSGLSAEGVIICPWQASISAHKDNCDWPNY